MTRRTDSRRAPPDHARLTVRDGVWWLDGRRLRSGDLVEVRRARMGDIDVGDDWVPAVVGSNGTALELQSPSDFVPSTRGGRDRWADLHTLSLSLAEIRRVRIPTRWPTTPRARGKDTAPERTQTLEMQIADAENEGMVTESAKVSSSPDD